MSLESVVQVRERYTRRFLSHYPPCLKAHGMPVTSADGLRSTETPENLPPGTRGTPHQTLERRCG